jgi:hypothetical protein
MKNVITVVYVQKVSGTSKKTLKEYDMRMAQCIVERTNPETGAPEPLIGELVLPEKFKDTQPGRYEVTFGIAVSQDKRIGSVVTDMVAVPPAARAAAPAAAVKA